MKPQYTRRKLESITLPQYTGITAPKSRGFLQFPELTVPGLLWCALCTYWLWSALPFVLALPLGCVLGIVLFFVVAQIVASGATTTVEICVGGSTGWVLALLLTLTLPAARENAKATHCLRSVKIASTAFLMYAQDNDGSLPPGNVWETAVHPYVLQPSGGDADKQKTLAEVQCPLAPSGSGYALSQSLAGQSLETLAEPEVTSLVFDTTVSGKNAVATTNQLPRPGRHRGGNTVGYADGHVRWQKTTTPPAPAPKMYVRARAPRIVATRP